MPAIIKPDAQSVRFFEVKAAISAIIKPGARSGKNRDRVASSSPSELLGSVSPQDQSSPILRSSFSFQHGPGSDGLSSSFVRNVNVFAHTVIGACTSFRHGPGLDVPSSPVVPNGNGFAHTVIRAWQQDLHLRLRPDDVWLAILTQFSFFVNGNAEALLPIFVTHEDKPELIFDARGDSIYAVNLGAVAQGLAVMVQERLKDPNVATTLLPTFTTTTPHDQATAALALLGTMEEYFEYGVLLGCSFPSVTLLGERSDWADMLQRVAWFGTIGHGETAAWAVRLVKVLEYMVASFDRPDQKDVKHFWNHAVHEADSRMSGGIVSLSGWLTAFCWWGVDGKRVQSYSDEELSSHQLDLEGPGGYRGLTLDGVEFPVIERAEVPKAIVRVPVTFYPEGELPFKAEFLAGSMGMQVVERKTAVQPASGWWLLSTDRRFRQ